ncbi:hypothetical protein [Candidatus Accumulibacter vicinus]|uniref:Uncharacterized protein n=1 Tax=Candidatus Accumulibacter vicinus TaxID=2954382 RepID=A0A084Y533_9PROT|nr:hypothetical protein [Candidatus Accumulibacter vicinus]KFB69827.1 MAG: hypothetical protein CAPSK01_000540 [Candidatus Accumulibacter vicinus]
MSIRAAKLDRSQSVAPLPQGLDRLTRNAAVASAGFPGAELARLDPELNGLSDLPIKSQDKV